MEVLYQLMIDHGVTGFFIAAFLAGSFMPFSSEVVMVALITTGVDPWGLVIWGTLGNTLGSVFNYWIGSLGNPRWIKKWTGVSEEQLERGQRYVERYGFWAGWLAWVPLLGSLITVALGLMRARWSLTMLNILLDKFLRYWLIMFAMVQSTKLVEQFSMM
ncbi:MAG: YqaA family protein [Bacteroidales bacterium]|nr:YqaA family protein [Bacteroidales bacterium]